MAFPFLPLLSLCSLASVPQTSLARELSKELTSQARLAGTAGGERAARWVAAQLRQVGWQVEFDRREVLLSYPRETRVRAEAERGFLFEFATRYDPDAVPPGDVPPYNAYARGGKVEGLAVDLGRGLRQDYEALSSNGVVLAGRIGLAEYGGAYRGVKAELAEAHGLAGLLLYTTGDGEERGPVWPKGKWKPSWAAQRGSIAPLARAPGDPSTPGWPSPAPGEAGRRASPAELRAALPGIPVTSVGTRYADPILDALEAGEEVRVELELDAPLVLRPIVNVIARLAGESERWILAGNHRDAWVRGAQDAGSGTISLLLAARRLSERKAAGWRPACGVLLGFWDAEEFGLIGSTEWGEAHADWLREHALYYVNADGAVSGWKFGASGTPGLLGSLRKALRDIPAPDDPEQNPEAGRSETMSLESQWIGDGEPRFGLPGSGSDYTVFLHHLGLGILDISFSGNGGGQYHTTFDDFTVMDRHIDPGWRGHDTAGRFLARILRELADAGPMAFDEAEAARALARHARDAGLAREEVPAWLAEEPAERLAEAFERLAETVETARAQGLSLPPQQPSFYRSLQLERGLTDRPWYKNRLWAPGLESGYAAETWPGLRLSAKQSERALEAELAELIASIDRRADSWRDDARTTGEH